MDSWQRHIFLGFETFIGVRQDTRDCVVLIMLSSMPLFFPPSPRSLEWKEKLLAGAYRVYRLVLLQGGCLCKIILIDTLYIQWYSMARIGGMVLRILATVDRSVCAPHSAAAPRTEGLI